MTYQQLFKTVFPLPVMMAISLFCPKLILGGGIVGFIAGIVFAIYLIALFLYTVRLNRKIKQEIRAKQ